MKTKIVGLAFANWRNLLTRADEFLDSENHSEIEQMANLSNSLEIAMNSGDVKGTVKVKERLLRIATNLLPHLRNQELREELTKQAAFLWRLITQLKSGEANISHVEDYLQELMKGYAMAFPSTENIQ